MDTIKNYLDNMFMNIPEDQNTIKAKQDLLNMMEDKYSELKAEGKTENEAIGIVISEFGNIEEVVKELGIDVNYAQKMKDGMEKENDVLNDNNRQSVEQNYNSGVKVSKQMAVEYIEAVKEAGKKIAMGVTMCILSPVVMIILAAMFEEGKGVSEKTAQVVGMAVLLVLVAIAVGLFITNGMKLSRFEYLKKDVLVLDADTEKYIRDLKEGTRGIFAKSITIGVVLCIIAVIPVIIFGCMYENRELYGAISVALLLLIVSVAVNIFVTSGLNWGTFNVLLQEEDYTKRKKEGKDLTGNIAQIYWPVAVCIYLIWSFVTSNWEFTWIVWPVAGVLFGAIACVCNIIEKKIQN